MHAAWREDGIPKIPPLCQTRGVSMLPHPKSHLFEDNSNFNTDLKHFSLQVSKGMKGHQ